MHIPAYFKLYEIYNNTVITKNILLEPLCCIFRIILLIYKEKGTKISFYNNSITYNSPNILQGLIRTFYGDKRDDIHNLYYPFIKAFEWYSYEDPMFFYFYEKCILGLDYLLHSYEKDSIICHSLQHYKQMFLDTIKDIEIAPLTNVNESPLLNNLKEFWEKDEILIIFQTLNHLDKCNENDKQTYLDTIDKILSMKEKKLHDYITKASTTYN